MEKRRSFFSCFFSFFLFPLLFFSYIYFLWDFLPFFVLLWGFFFFFPGQKLGANVKKCAVVKAKNYFFSILFFLASAVHHVPGIGRQG